jgi:hypothetical protein
MSYLVLILIIGVIAETYYKPRLEVTRERTLFLFYNNRSIFKGIVRDKIYLGEI